MADHTEAHTATQAQSAAANGLLGSLVAPNQNDLLMDIYSGGIPTPKANQSPPQAPPVMQSPAKPVEPSSPVVVYKEAPQNPKPLSPVKEQSSEMPAAIQVDDESEFSSESEKPKDEKELLRQKLALLKEKLKKARSVEEKAKMLERERDRELRQKEVTKKKAEKKALLKQKEQEKKQHSQIIERESRKPAIVKSSQPKSTPVKKAQPPKPATQKPLDINATEDQLDLNNKLHLVDELAKRWWYALPQWPPQDYDYASEISKRGLELCEANKIREPSELKRVCQVEAYPGVFRDADQKLYDLRPQETMPSLQNFQKKTVNELQNLLKKAYEEQLRVVQEMLDGALPSYDRETELEISKSLTTKIRRLQ